jgi:hypothetical protein
MTDFATFDGEDFMLILEQCFAHRFGLYWFLVRFCPVGRSHDEVTAAVPWYEVCSLLEIDFRTDLESWVREASVEACARLWQYTRGAVELSLPLDTAVDEFDITAAEPTSPTVPMTFRIDTAERVTVRMGLGGSEDTVDMPGKSARDVNEVVLEGFGLAGDVLRRAKPEAPQGRQRPSRLFAYVPAKEDESDEDHEGDEEEEDDYDDFESSYDSGTEVYDGADDVADERELDPVWLQS